jgi:hypothetical protein
MKPVVSAPAFDPLTLSEQLAERECSLNPDYLKIKLTMLATEFLVANKEHAVVLAEPTLGYLTRGFELIGLRSVASILSGNQPARHANALSQALFILSADPELDQYKLPELPCSSSSRDAQRPLASRRQQKNVSLRVEIEHSEPPIWRRLIVPGNCCLGDLHEVIQEAFGWEDMHLHQFEIRKQIFSCEEYADPREHEDYYSLDDFNLKKGSKFRYIYDLGDYWVHLITVEESHHDLEERWEITAGEQACPPEDCGGIWDYYSLLDALKNKKDPRHEVAASIFGTDWNCDVQIQPRQIEFVFCESADDVDMRILPFASSCQVETDEPTVLPAQQLQLSFN